jgi:NADH-quinone oxidoreductase subunit E
MQGAGMKKKATAGKTAAAEAKIIGDIISAHGGHKGALIPVLQEVQAALGYLSPATMAAIAAGVAIPLSQVYGVVTFYTQFRLKPIGRHLIRVCHGTACHVAGVEKVGQALTSELHAVDGETTTDGKFTLESVACLGCCSLAPVMMIDNETFGRLTPDNAVKAVKEFSGA